MKKLVSTLTAVAFVLGLTTVGFSQTTGKAGDKPAVKTETQVTQPQVAPQKKDAPGTTAKSKTNGPQKKGDKGKGVKTGLKSAKPETKPAVPTEKPQVEEKTK
ncbi:MAG: hypothetical protein AB1491_04950 [Thermodesulfobacteriota bacterium]